MTVVGILFALACCVVVATGMLIAFALLRRRQREKGFEAIDELRRHALPIISSLAAGTLDYRNAFQALSESTHGPEQAFLVEHLLFGGSHPTPISTQTLRRLAMDFGLVKLWEQGLRGHFEAGSWREALSHPEVALEGVRPLNFLLRARSAERLGLVRHQPSWHLLVEALDDPHPDVCSAAARALGAIAEPQSFSALVERLQAVVLKSSTGLSFRVVKAALVGFPLEQAGGLAESLKHSHPHVRFLATDVIREMVETQARRERDFLLRAENFAPELSELFLTSLAFDANPDVRARAAPVIARLDDPRAVLGLVALLGDFQWFVRLHAVRASAQQRLARLVEPVAHRLTDPNWRVREAAVRTLLSFGSAGARRLVGHFLATQDRYSLEQIAEELQRTGLPPALLAEYGYDGDRRLAQLVERLIGMGKSSCALALLQSGADHGVGEKLLEDFSHPTRSQARPVAKGAAAGG